jgi:hypothetical protein
MSSKRLVGRPIIYTYKKRVALLRALEAYIGAAEYPTMPEFCVNHGIAKQRIYAWAKEEAENRDTKEKYPLAEHFTELIKRMDDKQEYFIEYNAMQGKMPVAFAIFKLKQQGIGWTDRIDQNINGGLQLVRVTDGEAAGLD